MSAHRWFVAVAAALAFAAPVSAQEGVPAEAALSPATSEVQAPTPPISLAPRIAKATVGVRNTEVTFAEAMAPVPPSLGQASNVTLMIVGGAALVVGSLIDGDAGTLVMLSGGVIGLVGLYRFLG